MKAILFILGFGLVALSSSGMGGNDSNSPFHSSMEEKTVEAYLDQHTINPLLLMLSADKDASIESFQKANAHFEELSIWFRADLENSENEMKSLKKLFFKTQGQVFRNYELYSSLNQVFKDGTYNCVSGSAYYAYLLTQLGYQTSIWETPFHVYVSFDNSEGERVMIESTDPEFGFITSEKRMMELEAQYAEFEGNWGIEHGQLGAIKESNSEHLQEYKKRIGFMELNGLQYLNQGVTAFLAEDYQQAFQLISKAELYYPSPRTKSFLALFDH